MDMLIKEEQIEPMLEEIIFKIFNDRKELIKDIFEEVIEDMAMSKAIDEGRKNDFVEKTKIMDTIDNRTNL